MHYNILIAGTHIRKLKKRLWFQVLLKFIFVVSVAPVLLAPDSACAESSSLWNALRSPGHVALIRHSIAPGNGDPSTFVLDDCRTQRNLSEEGRNQAKRIGVHFRSNGILRARTLSSQWCRCRETAELLGLGTVEDLPILNSFFQRFMDRDRQTQELIEWLASQTLNEPLLLVTHQVNITALTNVYPSSGEIVVIHRSGKGKISVVGSLNTD